MAVLDDEDSVDAIMPAVLGAERSRALLLGRGSQDVEQSRLQFSVRSRDAEQPRLQLRSGSVSGKRFFGGTSAADKEASAG